MGDAKELKIATLLDTRIDGSFDAAAAKWWGIKSNSKEEMLKSLSNIGAKQQAVPESDGS